MMRRHAPILLVLLVAAPAFADGSRAEALFQEARELSRAGRYADACPRYAESHRLDPAFATLYNLGNCYEKIGRYGSAFAAFEAARGLAQSDADRARQAAERSQALAPRVSQVVITIAGGNAPGLEVRRDGIPLPASAIGVPLPLDPGEHVIEATAPATEPWRVKLTITDRGATIPVEVPLPRRTVSALAPVPAPAPVPVPVPSAPLVPSSSPADDSDPGSGMRIAGLVTGGVGLAGVGAGLIIMLTSGGSSTETFCDDYYCYEYPVEGKKSVAGPVLLGVGAAAVACGVVLYLIAPSKDERGVAVAPSVGPDGFGLSVVGRF